MRRDRAAHATVVIPAKHEESFTANESPSLQFLPRQQEAAGWQLAEDPIVVPGNKLATYLDSDAAAFLSYGAIDLTAGNYNGAGNNGFATVEIYRFPDFVKAFGAYSLHKVQTAQYVNIENEAFVGKHSVNIWRGPFYVRITGGGTPDGNQALIRLAQLVAERMPPAAGKPAVFNFLPTAFRVPNSERYLAKSGFGQPFLGNSFQATFNVNGAVADGLIVPAANAQTAAKILDAYRLVYIRNGKLMDPIPNLGEDNFTGEDKYLGRCVAFRIDRFVIAFNGYNDRQKLIDLAGATDQRILGTIRKELVSADNTTNRSTNTRNTNAPPWQRP